MTVILKNNAYGFLAQDISDTANAIVVQSGQGSNFPSLSAGQYFYATIQSVVGIAEIVKVTARSGDAMSIVRAQESTIALSFSASARVELRVTAQSVVDAINDRVSLFDQASEISFVPTGGIAATNVQDALAEVDSEKIAFTRLDDNDGSSLVGFLQSGTSAVATTVQAKLRETISVKDFGAKGDGVTDDTAAIQAAFNAVPVRGGAVYFPSGRYIVSDQILLPNRNPTYKVQIIICGESASSASDDVGSAVVYTGTTGALFQGLGVLGTDTSRRSQLRVCNIQIYGSRPNGDLTNTSIGFKLQTATTISFDNVLINGFDIGIEANGFNYYSNYNLVKFRRCRRGFVGSTQNGNTFSNCSFSTIDERSISLDFAGFQTNIIGCWFEGAVTTPRAQGEIFISRSQNVNITNCYFESSPTNAYIVVSRDSDVQRAGTCVLTGCSFQGASDNGYAIDIDNRSPTVNTEMVLVASGNWVQNSTNWTHFANIRGAGVKTYQLGQVVYRSGGDKPFRSGGTAVGGIDIDNGSIRFPSTQVSSTNANTLDDYEEGTWSADLVDDTGPLRGAGNANRLSSATYTKIGRQVTVQAYWLGTIEHTPSGFLRVTGLPFTPDARTIGKATSRYNNTGNAEASLSIAQVGTTEAFFILGIDRDPNCSASDIMTGIGVGTSTNQNIWITLSYIV
jgi:hypothetical protein